jgi:type IV pilus assembly protein PilV
VRELIVQKSLTGNRGFSLLELLIALVVFSIGLLAIAGLQTVSKQANFEALQRTTAAQVANGLLEDMRTNGNGIDVYAAAAQIGGGSIAAEPGPTCRDADECNAAEKAAHDLWFWEQILDGNLETNAGIAAGGLVLPTMCVTGPAAGGAGVYQVTIVWRGTASITNNVANACGTASGNYGAQNEFRRIVQIPTYIDPNF